MKSQPSKDGEIKIAIQIHSDLFDKNKDKLDWFIYTYQKGQQNLISSIIEKAKEVLKSLDPKKEYSLIAKVDKVQNTFRFITDENEYPSCFAQGAVIELYHSVGHVVTKTIETLQSMSHETSQERIQLLNRICTYSSDITFITQFDKQKGFQVLVLAFVSNNFSDIELCQILHIFVKIFDFDIIKWKNCNMFDKTFIERIIEIILKNKFLISNLSVYSKEDQQILLHSLNIIESLIFNGAKLFLSTIQDKLPLMKICRLLEHENHADIQQSVLALLNTILQYHDAKERREILKIFKDTLSRYVINRNDNGSEIMHQLYTLQTLLLQIYEEQLYIGATPEQTAEKWKEIRKNYDCEMDNIIKYQLHQQTSNNATNTIRSAVISTTDTNEGLGINNFEFDRFGLTNSVSMNEIFANPPGLLILNLLCYYSSKHNESFVKFILANRNFPGNEIQNQSCDCPLIIASFRILSLIIDILGLGKPVRDQGKEFYAMLLKHEHPLEEFFSIGLSIFNRTWHDIHATSNDIDIACDFLAEKFQKILSNSKATNSFENFLKELSKITYTEISRRWREERIKREQQKEEMPAIKELRYLLRPQMIEIVRKNRLNYLIRGTRFDKYNNKGQRLKDKFWYCRLSPNHKSLLYGDVEEDCKNLDDKLTCKFDIFDASRLVVGKECPHMRDTKSKKSTISLAFALLPRDDDTSGSHLMPLCFVAGKIDIYEYWLDGLNALLNQEMASNEAKKDADMLLDLDIKLRLLDIEGLQIPEKSPDLPPSPCNLNFEYQNQF